MTVGELRDALLCMDQDAVVLLNDGTHFMRRYEIAKIEIDHVTPALEPSPVVLVAKEL